MIEVGEASARILERITPLGKEVVSTATSMNRVLAASVIAPLTSPPWDNSSMDGYAIRSDDVTDQSTTLRVVSTIAAGEFAPRPLEPREAMRIMTGAAVPSGADSVIRREDSDEGRETVTFSNLRDIRKNIRRAGEDFTEGDLLFAAGESLGAAHIGVLASAGVREVEAHRVPRVAIISSGNELVDLDDFSPDLASRKIVSSNSLTLAALVRDAGGEPVYLGIARDDPQSLRRLLEKASDCDLIITSAGISVGDQDHVRAVIGDLGGELVFWKVRMRPGAPLAFGTLGQVPWLGLSGNPVSAIVSFEVFVRPVIRRMLGFSKLFRETVKARVTDRIHLGAPLMHFLRSVVTREADGVYTAVLAGSQSSSVLTALARANALLILPADNMDIGVGEMCRALPLRDDFGLSSELILT
ncbi:MAG TPA: gephyrin-like molybdotransferase Glp [Gemmatimonadaceae bacterium]|nr:gephyrin-like molybdotransferase Glp [Gemmatimonadaceae bacterium]